MNDDDLKSSDYRKNSDLEALLYQINRSIGKPVNSDFDSVKSGLPRMFIVGVPRSGTTLLSQWLADLNLFCFPTNFISRFYNAPYLGALIQEMLFNERYNYKDELLLPINSITFQSDIGKTRGPLEPHEFWYFWRRFFEFPETPISNEEFLLKARFEDFNRELNEIQRVFKKPIFLKSLIINPYITSFTSRLSGSIFLYIKRDPVENMLSLLNTRRKYFNDENTWFSFKPKEYKILAAMDPEHQIAGQVYFLNKEIENQLKDVPPQNKVVIDYSDLCEHPAVVYQKISTVLDANGFSAPMSYSGRPEFLIEKGKISPNLSNRLKGIYQSFVQSQSEK